MDLMSDSRLLLLCVACKTPLVKRADGFFCSACARLFPCGHNRLSVISEIALTASDKKANGLRDFFKRWPGPYQFIRIVFGQGLFTGLSAKKFLRSFPDHGGLTVNLGSGPSAKDDGTLHVDMFPYDGVHLVADIASLPFCDGSVSRVVCDNVLEHVRQPERVVSEIERILSPGGTAYICIPFLHAFHASPWDFTRWTEEGIANIFSHFSVIKKGVRLGPGSALTLQLSYIFALVFSFGNASLYWFLVNVSMFLFFPIKFIDILLHFLPRASDSAAMLYYVVQKERSLNSY